MEKKEIILSEAQKLIDILVENAVCSVEQTGENSYIVSIALDDNPSLLIGHHGELLNAIQKILSVIIFRCLEEKVNILVDINEYRSRQKSRLESIAENFVQKVVRGESDSVVLSSFSSFERKIIHMYISAKYPELETFSEGEGKHRKLIIRKKTDNK